VPTFPEVLVYVVLALCLGGLLRAILLLRRLRRRREAGWEALGVALGPWHLSWPAWWPPPGELAPGVWEAAPLDHDGRLLLRLLPAGDPLAPEDTLRHAFAGLGAVPDAWEPEEFPGRHGTATAVESRATWSHERLWIWAARVPAPRDRPALLLLYRASVLYGMADGCWLQEVAATATLGDGPGEEEVETPSPASP